jgi:hypothetical protein
LIREISRVLRPPPVDVKKVFLASKAREFLHSAFAFNSAAIIFGQARQNARHRISLRAAKPDVEKPCEGASWGFLIVEYAAATSRQQQPS